MARAIRLDDKGPQPSEQTSEGKETVRQVASDEDVRKAIKRVTRDHEKLIKALAK